MRAQLRNCNASPVKRDGNTAVQDIYQTSAPSSPRENRLIPTVKARRTRISSACWNLCTKVIPLSPLPEKPSQADIARFYITRSYIRTKRQLLTIISINCGKLISHNQVLQSSAVPTSNKKCFSNTQRYSPPQRKEQTAPRYWRTY